MLIASEDEEFEANLDSKDDDDPSSQLATSTNNQLTLMELSMFALGGTNGPSTMKLHGHIAGIEVMVMVDSDASHCFINQTTVDKLGLQVTCAGRFGIGSQSISTGLCHVVIIQLGSTEIQVNCFVFPLGTVDLILGITWFATLGEVRSNWIEPSMKFKQGKEWMTLRRDPTLVRSDASVRSLQKLCDVNPSNIPSLVFLFLVNLASYLPNIKHN